MGEIFMLPQNRRLRLGNELIHDLFFVNNKTLFLCRHAKRIQLDLFYLQCSWEN